jgi:tetratricopeptide (TPR) repeat protein
MVYHTLSGIARWRFYHNGNAAFLDESLHLQRVGLERLPETGSHDRHRHLCGLARTFGALQYIGRHQDKNFILSIMSEAFQVCPPKHVDKDLLQSLWMNQLLAEYTSSGELEFLSRSIDVGRQALTAGLFPNAGRRAYLLSRLADALRTRYEMARTNDKDLDESVELSREALQTSALDNIDHSCYVRGLAQVLVLQFRSDGNVSHLEEASQLYHHASDIMPKEDPWRPVILSGFAQSLGLHFRETGDISELNQAIDLDVEAATAMRPSASNYVAFNLQMASHLCLRFEALNRNDDLERAIDVAEELLKSLTNGDIDRVEAVHILAKARLLHAESSKYKENLDLSIAQLLSLKCDLSRSLFGPESLRILAACHLVNFRRFSIVDHAMKARDAITEVLESVVPHHYERFQCLIDAAELYMEPGTPYRNIDTALKHLSDAMKNSHRDVRSKIRSANHILKKMEVEQRDIFITRSSTSLKLLDIIGATVLLLPRVAFFGIHPYSRLKSLQEGQSIAMTGASHALNLSLPEKALEIMEQGRAIFWTHTLRLRSPFDDIPHEYRDRLLGLARRLEKVTSASDSSMDRRRVEREVAQRRKDSEEFNSLVDQVRCLPGKERFMLPEEFSTLRKVAEKGPVVVLACSTLACHAIVLMRSGKASSIPLEGITERWIMESASAWRSSVIQARLALRDERKLTKSKKAFDSRYTEAERILRILWINVILPVMKALRIEVRLNILYLKLGLTYITYSQRMVVIVPAFGGVQLGISRICQFTQQVLTANGAQITWSRPTRQQLAACSAQERRSYR